MQGVSRGSYEQTRQALQAALDSGCDWTRLSDDLFAVVGVLDANTTLARALADPSQEGQRKRELAGRLFGGQLDPASAEVVAVAVAQRWSRPRDLTDAVEDAAIEVQVAMADAAGRADAVEEQLFRFERTVAADNALREALGESQAPTSSRLALVDRLIGGGRVHPETERLIRELVSHPRGRRFAAGIEHVLDVAEKRRSELAGVVFVAQSLTEEQHDRLTAALERLYGRTVTLRVVIDPAIVGGIRVQVGDDVIDGSVSRRLADARRRMGG